jgi:hypothetical protein
MNFRPSYSVCCNVGAREISGSWFPSLAEAGKFLANLGQSPVNLPQHEYDGATRGAWGAIAARGRAWAESGNLRSGREAAERQIVERRPVLARVGGGGMPVRRAGGQPVREVAVRWMVGWRPVREMVEWKMERERRSADGKGGGG